MIIKTVVEMISEAKSSLPDKSVMNPHREDVFDLEDFFYERSVFKSGIREKEKASFLSYGTVIDYEAFDKCKKEMMDEFKIDVIFHAIGYWNRISYLSPMAKLLSLIVKKYVESLGITVPEESEESE